jgi:diadenylate cyclase
MSEIKEINEVTELAGSEKTLMKEDAQSKEKDFLEILKIFAPGTSLRSALDDLLGARMGALIVVENELTRLIIERGFKINSKFSPQRLVELAKMDGAIILSGNMKKILYANALLFPSIEVQTKETGTRHKAAERTAKQTGALVIAVSERKNKITIYCGELKHELKESSEILRRAAETLQILEKQREVYNNLIANLNLLEIENFVTMNDLCSVLQRLEIIKRISGIVKKYLIELGKEGMVVSMRLKELTGSLSKEEEMILKDYFESEYLDMGEALEKMSFDSLLEVSNISKMLFGEMQEKVICPKGLRLLSKIKMPEDYFNKLTEKYENLDKILSLDEKELIELFESKELFDSFNKRFSSLKEKIVMGKII